MDRDGGILFVGLDDVVIDNLVGAAAPDIKPGTYLKITVSDTGIGIEPQIIDFIFEPYFTTKQLGEGTGMGLSMVHGIVESSGETISVKSTLGKGSVFEVFLPVTNHGKSGSAYRTKVLPTGTEHILFVDDEAPIASMGAQMLERLGYKVTAKTSSLEALDLFRLKPDAFDLVITHMAMPNMTGDLLAAELMRLSPGLPVILCTGYSHNISDESVKRRGIRELIYKPVVKAELAGTVRRVLDATDLK